MTHVQPGADLPTSTEQLAAAFNLFNQLSDNLGESYRELQERVSNLNSELAVERTQRFADLAAKEQLAHRLSHLLNSLPGGVIVLNDNDCVTDANPVAMALLGKNVVGRSWQEALNENTNRELLPAALFGQPELEFSNGTCVSLSARVLDAKGNGIVLVTDVTEARVEREKESREQRLTALGEMSARLAHQLRTPLSAALLYVSHLSQPHQSDQTRELICEKLSERIQHLEGLINSMLSFVRGESRAYEKVAVDDLIEELVCIAELQASQVSGRVIVKGSTTGLSVYGGSEELLSALIGLVENAFQISDDITLTITVEHDQQWVDILIGDDGPGVTEPDVRKIFDPYYSSRIEGTGLGLAIAQLTAKEHGGSLELVRSGQGGAVFRFRIPDSRMAIRALDANGVAEVQFCD